MSTASAASTLDVRHLGRQPYGEALELQRRLQEQRANGEIPDTVLLLEHPDVITFGRSTKGDNAALNEADLRAAGYDVHYVNRGGDATYHGPGQLVGYLVLDLAQRGQDVHVYLRQLEGAMIETLAAFGIPSRCREGYAGVWMDDLRKIVSIGVGLRRWTTLHGFAINVNCDLTRFDAITPCGLEGVEMVSLSQVLRRRIHISDVAAQVETQLRKVFE